jgi:hypothetical protein
MGTLAAQVNDTETQAIMRLASEYDKLAIRAEQRADGRRQISN